MYTHFISFALLSAVSIAKNHFEKMQQQHPRIKQARERARHLEAASEEFKEVCSMEINRMKDKNFDFNQVLETANYFTDQAFSDDTFVWPETLHRTDL